VAGKCGQQITLYKDAHKSLYGKIGDDGEWKWG